MAQHNPDVEERIVKYQEGFVPQLAYLHNTDAEQGLIPPRMFTPPDGVVETEASVDLMIRVAYSLLAPMQMPDGREALDYEKAQRAGCPPELWHRISGHPEFKQIYMQAIGSTTLLPALKDSVRAVNRKALMGDKDAFKSVTDMLHLGDNPDEDGQRAVYRSMDQETFLRTMAELGEKHAMLYGRLTAPQATQDRTKEIMDGEEVLAPPPEEEAIDHAKIHGEQPSD